MGGRGAGLLDKGRQQAGAHCSTAFLPAHLLVGVTGAADDALALFAVTPTTLARTAAVRLPTAGVGAVAMLPGGSGGAGPLVAAGGWDGVVRLIAPGPPPVPMGAGAYHAAPVAAAAFQAGGEWLATGGRDGAVALWRLDAKGGGGDDAASLLSSSDDGG